MHYAHIGSHNRAVERSPKGWSAVSAVTSSEVHMRQDFLESGITFLLHYTSPTSTDKGISPCRKMSGTNISLSLSARKKPPPTNGVKRSHTALQDHDHDDETEIGQSQDVSHFDRSKGGAVDEKKFVEDKGPLIIAPQKNRDWKEASVRNKRFRYAQTADAERLQNGGEEAMVAAVEDKKPAYGLNLTKKTAEAEALETNGHDASKDGDTESAAAEEKPQQSQSADNEAMAALLGKGPSSTLVLPSMSEEQAFERDYASAPEMATLADYDRVPVEQFGAALLRGMGWKDGEGIGSNKGKPLEATKIPKRRPAMLGIGAKEEAAVAGEMGAWGKFGRGGKEVQVYNPVLLRDKRTGEMLTEEEVDKRKADEEKEKYEMEFEEKERRRKEDRKDRDDKKDRRHRSRSRDKDNPRRGRERDRDDSDYDRDRERSGRHGGDRERERKHHSDRDSRRDRHSERRY
jgi:hypothetical protein